MGSGQQLRPAEPTPGLRAQGHGAPGHSSPRKQERPTRLQSTLSSEQLASSPQETETVENSHHPPPPALRDHSQSWIVWAGSCPSSWPEVGESRPWKPSLPEALPQDLPYHRHGEGKRTPGPCSGDVGPTPGSRAVACGKIPAPSLSFPTCSPVRIGLGGHEGHPTHSG